jgi:uncharacterized Zn-binding protein involved in type VI secretion
VAVPAATGNLLGRAAQAAGKPPGHHLDVWKHSALGLKEQMKNYDPDAPPPPVQAMENQGKESTDGNARSPSDVAQGMAQQASAIPKQLAQLFHAGDGPPPQGVLQHVGAAFGVLTSVEQLVSMPLALIPFPALPAVRIGDYDIGLPHGHSHPPNLVPPAPPVPLPSTGPVISIPIFSGASTVLINGKPAARCGDLGLGIWCGGYFPLYEIFLGSSNVWLEGARAARLGVDITKHCIFSSPKPATGTDPPLGPMFGFTISGSGNVFIGGIPMPSLTAKAMGAALKPLFKGLGKVLRALRKRLRKVRVAAAKQAQIHPLPAPHAKFDPKVTDQVLEWLKDPDLWYGGGRKVIKKIHAGELLALTHATGHEWAAVVQKDGKLVLIHGEVDVVNLKKGDQCLMHTHPADGWPPGTDLAYPSDPDMKNAEGNSDYEFWDHPQAVMDENGAVRYYDKDGVITDPSSSMVPIGADGMIDGVHHMPGGPSNMSALPPNMNKP